jgi:hypothetical protein
VRGFWAGRLQPSGYTQGSDGLVVARGRPEASRAPVSAGARRPLGALLRPGRRRRRMVAPSQHRREASRSCRACLFDCQMLMHSAQRETPPWLPSAVSRWRKQRVGSPQHTQGCNGCISKRVYMTPGCIASPAPGSHEAMERPRGMKRRRGPPCLPEPPARVRRSRRSATSPTRGERGAFVEAGRRLFCALTRAAYPLRVVPTLNSMTVKTIGGCSSNSIGCWHPISNRPPRRSGDSRLELPLGPRPLADIPA